MKPKNTHSILKISNLKIGYLSKKKTTVVAENITLETSEGNFIALLGKNGIGKSTLLKTLSKVLPIIKGSILYNDKDINRFSENEFAKTVSIVLTEKLPESNLSVFELIALGRQPYTNWIGTITEKDKQQVTKAITLCKIEKLTSKKCHQLSDGQLQKVLIARALAQDTPIILLDEPTAHLDIHHKVSMFALLKKLAKETQKTIIISTHEVNMALQMANTLWLFTEGDFTTGTPKNLIENKKLHTLFPSELVKFDTKSRQFIVN